MDKQGRLLVSQRPQLSVIVPALDEASWIRHTLRSVRASLSYGGVDGEVIVSDGGSSDGTVRAAEQAGADDLVRSEPGRARQLNCGAERATGEVLALLHADTVVHPEWAAEMCRAVRDGAVGGWCAVDIIPEGRSVVANALGAVATGINWRTRQFRTATGDQSLFVRRRTFEALGGMPDQPIMEGAEFASRLRAFGPVAVLETSVRISGRRWERTGLIRSIASMYAVRAAYAAGADPERLHRLWDWATAIE